MMIGLFTIGPKLGGYGFDDGFPAWTKYLADDTRLRIGTWARRYGAYLVATGFALQLIDELWPG